MRNRITTRDTFQHNQQAAAKRLCIIQYMLCVHRYNKVYMEHISLSLYSGSMSQFSRINKMRRIQVTFFSLSLFRLARLTNKTHTFRMHQLEPLRLIQNCFCVFLVSHIYECLWGGCGVTVSV